MKPQQRKRIIMKVKTLIAELKDRLRTSIDMANDAGSRVKMYQQLLDKEQKFYTSMLCDGENTWYSRLSRSAYGFRR